LNSLSDGSYTLVSRYDGQDIDVQGASTANNVPIIQWANNGGANQHWIFVAI
jgi:hypothetical protein